VTFLQAIILGIVQGITEFFPISSSSHLRLAKSFLQIHDGEHLLYFDLLCHAGTLLALMIYLRRDIFSVLTHWKQIGRFTLALIPLIPGYFFLKPVRIALSDPIYLGYALLMTSALLFIASRKRPTKEPSSQKWAWGAPLADGVSVSQGSLDLTFPDKRMTQEISEKENTTEKPSTGDLNFLERGTQAQKWTDVVWIGIAQTFALIPGISRSGSTIAMARFCGWSLIDAAKFSFLLAVPTILGGEVLETWKFIKGSSDAIGIVSMKCYAAGFCSAFGVGLIAVRAVFWIYEREIIRPFAWYCLGVGILSLAMFHG